MKTPVRVFDTFKPGDIIGGDHDAAPWVCFGYTDVGNAGKLWFARILNGTAPEIDHVSMAGTYDSTIAYSADNKSLRRALVAVLTARMSKTS